MWIHVIQKGETLWLLSRRYGVSIDQIMEANQLPNPNILVVGQAVIIPQPKQIHIVQPGETLWLISRKYGVSIEDIINANQITDPNRIVAGQRLVIPQKDKIHIVQPGETLWSIAQRYHTTVEEISRDNQITNPNLIYPNMTLRIRKPMIEVNGYLTQMGTTAQGIISDIGQHLTYLSNFSYSIKSDGGLTMLKDSGVIAAARTKGVQPMMVITNFAEGKFDSQLAHTVLTNLDVQDTLIDNMINTMGAKGYRLLNIDFEYLFPEDRESYNQFLSNVTDRLHAEGYFVSTALAPKVSGEQKGLLYEAHDYPAQGKIVDFIILMTYEWGWIGGPPMAVAPINEVKKVLDYAVSVIPRNKIMMGMPTYGYDWKLPYVRGKSRAEVISPQEAIQRAARHGADIQYDQTAQSPYYNYIDEAGNEHIVWFEDARSVQAKYETVKNYMLRGVSYWELTSPFPQNWYVLDDYFQIRKY